MFQTLKPFQKLDNGSVLRKRGRFLSQVNPHYPQLTYTTWCGRAAGEYRILEHCQAFCSSFWMKRKTLQFANLPRTNLIFSHDPLTGTSRYHRIISDRLQYPPLMLAPRSEPQYPLCKAHLIYRGRRASGPGSESLKESRTESCEV